MNFARGIFAIALACASASFADVVFSADFENRAAGQYTDKMAQEDFPKKAGVSSWYAMERQ